MSRSPDAATYLLDVDLDGDSLGVSPNRSVAGLECPYRSGDALLVAMHMSRAAQRKPSRSVDLAHDGPLGAFDIAHLSSPVGCDDSDRGALDGERDGDYVGAVAVHGCQRPEVAFGEKVQFAFGQFGSCHRGEANRLSS